MTSINLILVSYIIRSYHIIVNEYPIVDGHLSINVYLNALTQSYETFKQKYLERYRGEVNYHSFDYFCFHTPFSKMVQKCFFHLLYQDIKKKPELFSKEMIDDISKNGNKYDEKILIKHMGKEWKNKCEISLLLAKHLGNIYTGSLYNGLLSLLSDTSIDLSNKKILMFSYGSGCASSMFMIKVEGDYKKI